MCGIVGVTGEDDVRELLIDGLRRLEYRGYDSAGVALVDEEGLYRERVAHGTHSVDELAIRIEGTSARRTGLGHTRWATHGKPSEDNAHPHLDCTGTLAIVHNGIIENHTELCEQLRGRGHTLVSETDTEIVAHLLEEELAQGRSLLEAVRATLPLLRGSFS